ncbi:MAG: FUSC family protein [Thermomicrobiales bacterium]
MTPRENDGRLAASARAATLVAAAIVVAGALLTALDWLLRSVIVAGEPVVPLGAFAFAVLTVTVQYSETRRPLGQDFRQRLLATAIGCLLGALLWRFGGETLAGVALAAAVAWLAGGLVNQDFAPRTAAGVAAVIALGAGYPLATPITRIIAIAAATVATALVLRYVWREPAPAAGPPG